MFKPRIDRARVALANLLERLAARVRPQDPVVIAGGGPTDPKPPV